MLGTKSYIQVRSLKGLVETIEMFAMSKCLFFKIKDIYVSPCVVFNRYPEIQKFLNSPSQAAL